MNCPTCQSQNAGKNGTTKRQDASVVQKYLCKACNRQFNERTGTPMSRLGTASAMVGAALNVRTEGLGLRASGRSFGKSHSTIMRWEQRVAQQSGEWSPPAPVGADVNLEGDEVYTRVGFEPSPPKSVKVGQSSLSNARAAIGLPHKQAKSRVNCLSRGLKVLGIGPTPPSSSAGLPMANAATAKPCGNLPVSISNQEKPIKITITARFGGKG